MITKGTNFRFSVETLERMDELCRLAGGISRTALLLGLVNAEYDRVHGHPELKAIIEQMTALQKQFETISGVGK